MAAKKVNKKKVTTKKVAKKATTKAVAKVEDPGELADMSEFSDAFGTEDIDQEDLIIPKILAMQGLSQLVSAGKAKFGDMVDSLTEEVLGGVDKPIQFIPFKTAKQWIVFHDNDYKETVSYTPANHDWPIEEVVDGVNIRRDKVLQFYCLLPEQIESGEFLPYVLSFRRTSYYAGRKLSSAFARLRMFKKPAFSKVFELSVDKQVNDKNQAYMVFDTSTVRNSSIDEMRACKTWYDLVKGNKVDDSDLKPQVETPSNHVKHEELEV